MTGPLHLLGSLVLVRLEHLLKEVLIRRRCKEFADELANPHVLELCLERQLSNHVLRERQFSSSFLALVLHLNGKFRPYRVGACTLLVRCCSLSLLHLPRR